MCVYLCGCVINYNQFTFSKLYYGTEEQVAEGSGTLSHISWDACSVPGKGIGFIFPIGNE